MQRFVFRIITLGCICHLLLVAGETLAQKQSAVVQEVAATVDDEPIYAAEVTRLLNRVVRGHEVNPAVSPLMKAQILEEIVDRRLVLAYARRTGCAPKTEDIDLELGKLKSKLASRQQSWADYLKSQSITEIELKRQIAWNMVWEKYQAQYITESRLESYFQSHRRDFDGSKVSVSHILLQPPKNAKPEDFDGLFSQAAAIREEIASGKITFAEAARKYSAGPSAKDGGQLGFIPRHGVMDEAFSRAAFELEIGRVSEPVRTPFGVHLLRCDEIKAGEKQLKDVHKEIEEALARELLEKLARTERGFTSVEYTGKSPYLKPGTRELVMP
ncbi:MAG: peptidylprolyl isomerase [Thermoguttaceae bacterium]|jgi:peptidyl-prolyl cis-trans isomerase C